MVTYVDNPAGLAVTLKSPTGPVAKDLAKRGAKLTQLARRQVGVSSGVTRSSIYYIVSNGVGGELEVTVGANSRVALMHHNGTRPHVILPRHSSMLRFSRNGRVVFARRVLHPGTRPNRFLTDNLPRVVLT